MVVVKAYGHGYILNIVTKANQDFTQVIFTLKFSTSREKLVLLEERYVLLVYVGGYYRLFNKCVVTLLTLTLRFAIYDDN